MITMFHTFTTFTQTFCCFLPCPLGLIVFAIPPFLVTLRRRKALQNFNRSIQDLEVCDEWKA